MAEGKQPMQADGGGKVVRSDGVQDPGSGGKGSESNGDAYPAPKRKRKSFGGAGGHGGQSEIAYHGTGQLGERSTGGNRNSVTGDQD